MNRLTYKTLLTALALSLVAPLARTADSATSKSFVTRSNGKFVAVGNAKLLALDAHELKSIWEN